MIQLGELNKKWTYIYISTTRSITYARKVYHSVVTNDRLLSDTRRIIPTLRACIIELFIPMFHTSLCRWQVRAINKHLRFTDRGTRNERITYICSSGRIIYWKLGNFWMAVNDGRNAASYASPLVSGRFSSALFFLPFERIFLLLKIH